MRSLAVTAGDHFIEFVWLPTFERTAAGLLDEDARRELELALVADPVSGVTIPRTGGFRKLRWAKKDGGKRGGARIIYYYVAHRQSIYMVLAYSKRMKENLSEADRAQLRELARSIKKGRG